MSDSTKIEWTEATWNPVTGCTRVSAGCDNCYAVRQSHRLEGMGQVKYAGLTVVNGQGERHFNGTVRCHEDELARPLRWKKSRRIFVNSMSDLFHREVSSSFIGKVFDVATKCPQHTFQILTKRPERVAKTLGPNGCKFYATEGSVPCPQPNVWLGTSCEDQKTADERIPHLLNCSAAVRFLSLEPLLGPIDILAWGENLTGLARQIHWVIVGGESGPHARPMHPDWVRSISNQCKAADVAFFFKQWGGRNKKAAGRELDGRTWDEMPKVAV